MPSGGSPLADRLRAALREAEIPAPDADVERVLADGSLERLDEYARQLSAADGDTAPDYVASWTAEMPEASRSGASGASGLPGQAPSIGSTGVPPTIAEAGALVCEADVSPVELTDRALAVIEERDGELNAFQLVLHERAREAARRAEAEIARGEYRGPLHGIPVAVKDLFAMRGTPTTAGSVLLARAVATRDSAVVARLAAAGAVIVGKTRLPEFAFWPGSSNPHYGPTLNPHDLTRDAGGSSSGSAVAVATGMAYGAVGSDTGGSIRVPAALCGIVGLKPTFGRVDLDGCVPLAWSLDHAGPLTRTVGDAALLLDALTGEERSPDEEVAGPGGEGPPEAALRVAVLAAADSSRALAAEEALSAWRASCDALAAAGAELTEVSLPEMPALRAANLLILSVEAAAFHAPTLRSDYGAYGEPCRSRLLGGFAFSAVDLVQAHRFRRLVRRRWGEALSAVDVLSTPCQPDVAPPLGEPGSTRFTGPFNALGWPAISVPFGRGSGRLPLATQLVGKPWREADVLRAARALESAREGGTADEFLLA